MVVEAPAIAWLNPTRCWREKPRRAKAPRKDASTLEGYLCDRPEHRDEIGRTTYARSDVIDEADRKKGIVTEAR